MANEFKIKNGFISNGDSSVLGSLSATTISGDTYYSGGTEMSTLFALAGGGGIYDGSGTVPSGTTIALSDSINFDSNTLVIDGTNNRVGIGNSTPVYDLQIGNGSTGTTTIGIGGALNANHEIGFSVNGDNVYHRILSNASSGEFRIQAGAVGGGHRLTFFGGTSESMRIIDGGNVGINTTTPSATLDVNGDIIGTTMSAGTLDVDSTVNFASMSGSTDRFAEVDSGGTVSATRVIYQAYLPVGATTALLDDTNNWDIDGVYTGTSITGTVQGQKWYNSYHFFEAVDDDLFIRTIRG